MTQPLSWSRNSTIIQQFQLAPLVSQSASSTLTSEDQQQASRLMMLPLCGLHPNAVAMRMIARRRQIKTAAEVGNSEEV